MKETGKVIGLICIGMAEIVITGMLLAIGFHFAEKIINRISGRRAELPRHGEFNNG